MADRVRFHLDERIDPDLARALRQHGIDVSTTQDAGLRTQPDDEQWRYVNRQPRTLVTRDPDFLHLAEQTSSHPGIVFCVRKSRSLGDLIQFLVLIHEVLSPDEMSGQVEFF